MFRKTIFWIHLVSAVATALVILMMSVTGVVLTYQRQMLDWAERDLYATPDEVSVRQPIETIVETVALSEPGFRRSSVIISANEMAPVAVSAGMGGSRLVNPYTGEYLGVGAPGMREFFGTVTGWHRWFNVSGEARAPWRAITGASNLVFLFLILSGMYLWLPKVFRWALFRARLMFDAKATGHARDFNWHHVIGIWTAIPLAVVVATASVFYYPWANDLVYRAAGDVPPSRAASAPAPASRAPMPTHSASESADPNAAGTYAGTGNSAAPPPRKRSLDELFDLATEHLEGWREIAVQIPGDDYSEVVFTIDVGNGGQPQRRHSLTLDAYTGGVAAWEPFDSQSPGRQARLWVRFLHTGEALGLAGQTVAGLVSLTSVLMVWTGLALAYRRLIVPLLRPKSGRAK